MNYKLKLLKLALNEIEVLTEEILTLNIDKLKLRYPNKFTSADAIERNVVAERELLEKPTNYQLTSKTEAEDIAKKLLEQGKTRYGNIKCGPIFDNSKLFISNVEPCSFSFTTPTYKGTRTKEWLEFAVKVADHIENYTIPQYQDKPNDQVENWSIEECFKAVKKYMARYGTNAREGQTELDFLKEAHFIQLAASKHEEVKAAFDKVKYKEQF